MTQSCMICGKVLIQMHKIECKFRESSLYQLPIPCQHQQLLLSNEGLCRVVVLLRQLDFATGRIVLQTLQTG